MFAARELPGHGEGTMGFFEANGQTRAARVALGLPQT